MIGPSLFPQSFVIIISRAYGNRENVSSFGRLRHAGLCLLVDKPKETSDDNDSETCRSFGYPLSRPLILTESMYISAKAC